MLTGATFCLRVCRFRLIRFVAGGGGRRKVSAFFGGGGTRLFGVVAL